MMRTTPAALAFAYRTASLSSLQFTQQYPLNDPTILPVNRETSQDANIFSVLNPASQNEDDPASVIATVSCMDKDDANEVNSS